MRLFGTLLQVFDLVRCRLYNLDLLSSVSVVPITMPGFSIPTLWTP